MPRSSNVKLPAAAAPLSSESPLYLQLYGILKNAILDGAYPDGSLLPSEMELASAFGVSRITAKRALDKIASENFAIRQRGLGTRVRNTASGSAVGSIQSVVDSLRANSHDARRLLSCALVAAPPEAADALHVAAGEKIHFAERVFETDGRPYSYLSTYVPAAIARSWTADDVANVSLIRLLERSNVTVERAEQVIGVVAADARIATILDVAPGAPLLEIRRTLIGTDGRPVEYLRALYPAGRYRYVMSFV